MSGAGIQLAEGIVTALHYQFSKRIFAAAVRLAALYAVCVIATLAIVLACSKSLALLIDALPWLGIPGAICFAGAFVLLAVARRAGFIALWLILLGLWATPIILRGDIFTEWDSAFLFWTILAAPLYAMVMLGFRSAVSARSRARGILPWVLGAVWLGLVIVNLRFQFRPVFESYSMWKLYGLVSLFLPITVTAAGIRRVWRAPLPAAR